MEFSIYLDYNATTYLEKSVLEKMMPYLTHYFYNPSSLYFPAQRVREEIERAREKILHLLEGEAGEIIFTSGGTESDNHAIFGVLQALKTKRNQFFYSAIEHHAVLEMVHFLEREGFQAIAIPVDSQGIVDLDFIQQKINEKTALISVMHANNETGVIQPIAEIVKIAHSKEIFVHTDAVQTMGKIKVSAKELGVDLLSFSSHKFYGPKGVGGLWVKKGVPLFPLIYGGAQERRRRAGTENVAGIIGMAEALDFCLQDWEKEYQRQKQLRDYLEQKIMETIEDFQINGSREKRLANTSNISFYFVEGEALLFSLADQGICVSSGSACSSSSLEPSHVLLAMGLDHAVAHGSIRFSLGKKTTKEEIEQTVNVLQEVLKSLRKFSPFNREKKYF